MESSGHGPGPAYFMVGFCRTSSLSLADHRCTTGLSSPVLCVADTRGEGAPFAVEGGGTCKELRCPGRFLRTFLTFLPGPRCAPGHVVVSLGNPGQGGRFAVQPDSGQSDSAHRWGNANSMALETEILYSVFYRPPLPLPPPTPPSFGFLKGNGQKMSWRHVNQAKDLYITLGV